MKQDHQKTEDLSQNSYEAMQEAFASFLPKWDYIFVKLFIFKRTLIHASFFLYAILGLYWGFFGNDFAPLKKALQLWLCLKGVQFIDILSLVYRCRRIQAYLQEQDVFIDIEVLTTYAIEFIIHSKNKNHD